MGCDFSRRGRPVRWSARLVCPQHDAASLGSSRSAAELLTYRRRGAGACRTQLPSPKPTTAMMRRMHRRPALGRGHRQWWFLRTPTTTRKSAMPPGRLDARRRDAPSDRSTAWSAASAARAAESDLVLEILHELKLPEHRQASASTTPKIPALASSTPASTNWSPP